MKVFYHGDADGECAAAILYKSRGGNKEDFIEMQYEKPVPFELISKNEEVFILDFSFKPTDFKRLKEITNNIIWIDHHASCLSYSYAQDPDQVKFCDFTDHGPSGCELTWKYFYPKMPAPIAVMLVGDYDSWRLQIPESGAFHIGLKLYDTHPTSETWRTIIAEEIVERGKTCIQFRDAYCKNLVKDYGFETEILGVKAFACNQYRFGSQGFGNLMNEYPICISFIFNGTKYIYGLYSNDPKIDCAEICKKFGGGGHKGAAGFISKELVILNVWE